MDPGQPSRPRPQMSRPTIRPTVRAPMLSQRSATMTMTMTSSADASKSQRRRHARRQRRKKRIKETVTCCKHFLAFMFSNLGLSSLIILYVILGGELFRWLEQGDELRVKAAAREHLDSTVKNVSGQLMDEALRWLQRWNSSQAIWDRSSNASSIAAVSAVASASAEDFQRRFAGQMREFSRQLIKRLTDDGWNGRYDDADLNWSFSGALLYVVTVITTIGYGQVVPKTEGGYLLTMLYAFFGIPLTFLYLNNVGDYLADAFRLFYRDAFRPFWRRVFRKRTRQRARTLALEWQRAVAAKIPISLSHVRLHRLTERLQAWTAENLGDSDDRQDEEAGLGTVVAAAPDQRPLLAPAAATPTATPGRTRPLIESTPLHLASSAATIRVAYVMARVLPAREANQATGAASTTSPLSPAAGIAPLALENGDCFVVVNPLMDEVQTPISQKAIMDWTSDELQQVPLIDWEDIDGELEERRAARGKTDLTAELPSGTGADFASAAAAAAAWESAEAAASFRRTRSAPDAIAASIGAEASDLCEIEATPSNDTPVPAPPPQSPTTTTTTTTPSSTPPPPPPKQLRLPRRPFSLSMSAVGSNQLCSPPWLQEAAGSNPMLRRCSYVSVHEPPTPTTPTIVEEDDDKDSMQGLSLRQVTVPLSLSVSVMILYIIFGALIFTIWEEDKNYIRWSYFCFITLSTIGFGDIVPGTTVDSENPKEKLIATVFYVAIGLSVFAMCFKLMQEEVIQKVRRLGRRIAIIRDRLSAGGGGGSGTGGGDNAGGESSRPMQRVNGFIERLRTRPML